MKPASELEVTGSKNIILYGPAGSGKTTLCTTVPGKKYFFMLDQSGLDSIAGLADVYYDTFFPEVLPLYLTTLKGKKDRTTATPKEPETYLKFDETLVKFLDSGFGDLDVIIVDSLTTLSLVLMDRILYLNGRQGHNPDVSDYLLVGNTLMAIMRTLTAQEKTIILTAHSDLVQDELSKKVFNQIDVMKNVRRLLPRIFSDVWITRSEGDATGKKFVIQTAPSRDFLEAKNSMNLDYIVDVTLDPGRPRTEQGISFVRPQT